ncbi:hypothetical protein BZA05DRAFT_392960 [Tricharina praecox]|uniref:uncharacterized protein n=1 Tax=Tricharina praecox TaxID=43433 RepID=UPI00222008DB|nr:uncharacterized protein BZA05DRAFT_392960 [Tricharina praecox]KAI5854921.1 hypothetical protein BZA05DRAFT_392960 [Tricharina praecox]
MAIFSFFLLLFFFSLFGTTVPSRAALIHRLLSSRTFSSAFSCSAAMSRARFIGTGMNGTGAVSTVGICILYVSPNCLCLCLLYILRITM